MAILALENISCPAEECQLCLCVRVGSPDEKRDQSPHKCGRSWRQ